jgi:hypothetical protein
MELKKPRGFVPLGEAPFHRLKEEDSLLAEE